jgi:hypothetical protein
VQITGRAMNIGKGRLKSKVEPGFQPEGEASKELWRIFSLDRETQAGRL